MEWRSQAGPPISVEQIDSFLRVAKPPTGLNLQDQQQLLTAGMNNLGNTMNNNRNPSALESNHSGFAIWLYEPKAWLGARKSAAERLYKTFVLSDVTADDRLPILRVIVHPDTPQYLTAIGAANANNADHVVLRSIDHSQVAQPLALEPTTAQFWNSLGARASFAGLVAVFSTKAVERIRSASPGREFLVTIVSDRPGNNRDFKIKTKHFERLGD